MQFCFFQFFHLFALVSLLYAGPKLRYVQINTDNGELFLSGSLEFVQSPTGEALVNDVVYKGNAILKDGTWIPVEVWARATSPIPLGAKTLDVDLLRIVPVDPKNDNKPFPEDSPQSKAMYQFLGPRGVIELGNKIAMRLREAAVLTPDGTVAFKSQTRFPGAGGRAPRLPRGNAIFSFPRAACPTDKLVKPSEPTGSQ